MLLRAATLARAAAATISCAAGTYACCDGKKSSSSSTPKTLAEVPAALSLRHRQVFLTGHIDDTSARLVIAQLLYLEEASPTEPIQLHINSSGGKVHAGIAIHDVMQSLRAPVRTTCLGHCESMAAVILAAGEKGERACMPNARVMIHQPTRTSSSKNSSKSLEIQAAELERSRLKLAELLAAATGKPRAEIEALLEHDTYYSAQGAVDLGLVDKVCAEGHFSAAAAAAAAEPPPAEPAAADDEPAAD